MVTILHVLSVAIHELSKNEYIDDLQKLKEHYLPPQAAFFRHLKNEGKSYTDYAICNEARRSDRITTMREFRF